MGHFRSRVGKEDQIGADPAPVSLDQESGGVSTAAVADNDHPSPIRISAAFRSSTGNCDPMHSGPYSSINACFLAFHWY